MKRKYRAFSAWLLVVLTLSSGCSPIQPFYLHEDGDLSHYLDVATAIEHPDVQFESLPEITSSRAPLTVANPEFDSIWELSLEESVAIALQNSKVIRSIGQVRQFGQLLGTPPERLTQATDANLTVYDVAIQESSNAGVEQALAVFDAQVRTTATWDSFDRPQNNINPADPDRDDPTLPFVIPRDQASMNTELSKLSASGGQWFFRNVTNYNRSLLNENLTSRARESDYLTSLEAEFRQPLLRGRGTQINRIPVVLARIRTDITVATFEASVRDLLSETERAYWELYFFYRNLEAAKTGRDSALLTWQKVFARYQKGTEGGEAQQEAQAREQYYFFVARVQEALRDLYRSETRLRYLMGLPATDGRLIRPSEEPTTAEVTFDWNTCLYESLGRSVEIRRQKWRVKQRELELIAARNQLLPQLDIIALYRWLGMGDKYLSSSGNGADFPQQGSTAWGELTQGRYQEGRLGFEMTVPLGFRREMAQVRSNQLLLARATARLEDMELEVSHQLNDAIQQLESEYLLAQTNLNRRVAAGRQVEAYQAAQEAGKATVDLVLEAQRRRAESEIAYFQSVLQYNLAVMQVHYRKGSLLELNNVMLAEGPWPGKAYFDADAEARRRDASHYIDYRYSRPDVVSNGEVDQHRGLAPKDELMASPQDILDLDGEGLEELPSEGYPIEHSPTDAPNEIDSPQTPTPIERRGGRSLQDFDSTPILPEPTPAQRRAAAVRAREVQHASLASPPIRANAEPVPKNLFSSSPVEPQPVQGSVSPTERPVHFKTTKKGKPAGLRRSRTRSRSESH